jgi:putative Holliday junction resolvase
MGERRIGLAISDPTGTIASPAGHILRRPGMRLPLDQNGEETERSAEARRVAELLGTRSGRSVRLVDERFTTAAAQRAIREMGGSTRGRKGDVDALAATVLLQHALQFQEPQP